MRVARSCHAFFLVLTCLMLGCAALALPAAAAASVTFSGVLKTASGQPVPGAFVKLENGGKESSAYTAGDGSFALEATAGENRLSVESGEGQGASLHLPEWFAISTEISLQQSESQTIVLPESVAIAATVRSGGSPVSGVKVYDPSENTARSYEPFPGNTATVTATASRGKTDASGEVTLYTFPTGKVPLYAILEESNKTRRDFQEINATENTTVAFTLPPISVTLSGVLKTASGQPVPGASVGLEGGGEGSSTYTAADGTFSLEGTAGEDELSLGPAGGQPASLHLPEWFAISTEISLQQSESQTIVLPESVAIAATVRSGGSPVSGVKVYDPSENTARSYEPFPGNTATVTATASRGKTDASGEVTLYTFPTGKVPLYAILEESNKTRRDFQEINATENTTVAFTLPPISVTLSGVLKTASGQPVPGASVGLEGGGEGSSTYTAADGTFSLEGTAGEDELSLGPAGGQPASLHLPEWFAISTEISLQQSESQTIVLPESVAIAATVRSGGSPVSGVKVYDPSENQARPYEPFPGNTATVSATASRGTTDASGEVTLYTFPTGKLGLYAMLEEAGEVRRAFQELSATASTAVAFILGSAPVVTSVTPAAGLEAGGEEVTITGTELEGASAVRFGTSDAGFRVISNTSIIATVPAGKGTVDVTVTTQSGVSAIDAGDRFSYVAPGAPPRVASIRPRRGPAGGGTEITITGRGFVGVTAVEFGKEEAASYKVDSATEITATAPAGERGRVDVRVATPNGLSARSFRDRFTYGAPRLMIGPRIGHE